MFIPSSAAAPPAASYGSAPPRPAAQQIHFDIANPVANAIYLDAWRAQTKLHSATEDARRVVNELTSVTEGLDDAWAVLSDYGLSWVFKVLSDRDAEQRIARMRGGMLTLRENLAVMQHWVNAAYANLEQMDRRARHLQNSPGRVRTCGQYRPYYTTVTTDLAWFIRKAAEMKRTLASFASTSGRRFRNQIKQAITDIRVGLSAVKGALTKVIRSNSLLGLVRRSITWADDEREAFDNLWSAVFSRTAREAARRGWNRGQVFTRDEMWRVFMDANNSWKNTYIKWGLKGLRTYLNRLAASSRQRASHPVPLAEARAAFAAIFVDYGRVVDRARSVRRSSGPLAKAYAQLVSAMNDLTRLNNQRAALMTIPPSAPYMIECQLGSEYSGYGAAVPHNEGRSAFDTYWFLAGGVALGLLGAHLHSRGI